MDRKCVGEIKIQKVGLLEAKKNQEGDRGGIDSTEANGGFISKNGRVGR